MLQRVHPGRQSPGRPIKRAVDIARRAVRVLLIAAVSLSLIYARVVAAADQDSAGEYELKAAMLYNLMKFVDWPNAGPGDTKAARVVCVAGWDPFGKSLDAAVANKSVNGRRIEIRRFEKALDQNNFKDCDVLYVSSSERRDLDHIVSGLQGADVLTVGEMNRFAERGGMVQFALVDKQVRLEVNLDAVSHTKLKISSKLLTLARIVREREMAAGT